MSICGLRRAIIERGLANVSDHSDRFRVEPLGKTYDRAAFSCGIEALDRYLRQQAGQDVRHKAAAVFVLYDAEAEKIAGYYTLSATSIVETDVPPDIARKLPRYPVLPAFLSGRLAIDQAYRGKGWGRRLLMAALFLAFDLSQQVGAIAVVVDAKDDAAKQFYEHYGFQSFPQHQHRLFIPMRQIAQLG